MEVTKKAKEKYFNCKKCGRTINEKFKSTNEENTCIWCNHEKYYTKAEKEKF
jgi:hypothetical protein